MIYRIREAITGKTQPLESIVEIRRRERSE